MPKMAVDSDHTPLIIGSGRAVQLCRELELAGIEPMMSVERDGALTSGATLPVDALAVRESAGAAKRLRQQLFDSLVAGWTLSLAVTRLGEGAAARDALSGVCEIIGLAAQDAGVAAKNVGIAIDASSLEPQAAWRLRSSFLGDGPLYLLPGHAMMRPDETAGERSRHERFWLQLWHLRSTGMLRPAYAPLVACRCPLLGAEMALGVIPITDIQAPAASAWVSMKLHMAHFADQSGSIHDGMLEEALGRAVEIGDELHALANWPTAQMRHDAWLNRRLAIVITGFGDLLQMRGLDPGEFVSLQSMCGTLRRVRDVLQRHSGRIARQAGHLPALEQADPSRMLPGGKIRCGWRKRWQAAVERAAIRHRNLLVLSPWSVFPAEARPDYRYANLLPLLGFADACAFPKPPALAHWNVNQFKSFHQRAWAVLQQRDTSQQIAEWP